MNIILGGTGHVGSAVVAALLEAKMPVTIVTRNEKNAIQLRKAGAEIAIADVYHEEDLKKVFDGGKALFFLNPPVNPSSDIEQKERQSVRNIVSALKNSAIEKVVAQSTYGAQKGYDIGDFGVLYEMEHELSKLTIPSTTVRGAYYMSNWAMALQTANEEGKIYSFSPPDFKVPMVAPKDLGRNAAALLLQPFSGHSIMHMEGPAAYTANDVAKGFSHKLGKTVEVVEIPPDQWQATFEQLGYSKKGAQSMAGMTEYTLSQQYQPFEPIVKGTTTLEDYISSL